MQVAQRWIVARLRNRRFFSLAELNAAIRDLVVALNDRVTRHLGASRRQLFEDLERPALGLCPRRLTSMRSGRSARSGSTAMSRSTATTIRCPTGCCARRSGAPDREDGPELFHDGQRVAAPPCAARLTARHTPARPHAVEPPALRRVDAEGRNPPRGGGSPAPPPRHWSPQSCMNGPIPSRASAPASASCNCCSTISNGWKRPANARSGSAPTRSYGSVSLGLGAPRSPPARPRRRGAGDLPTPTSQRRLLPLRTPCSPPDPRSAARSARRHGAGLRRAADPGRRRRFPADWLALLIDHGSPTATPGASAPGSAPRPLRHVGASIEDVDYRTA